MKIQKPTNVLSLPPFEATAEEVRKSGQMLLALSQERTKEIGTQNLDSLTFESSLGAIDDLDFDEGQIFGRIYFLLNVHPDTELREAAREVQVAYQAWCIEKAYDEGLYRVTEAFTKKAKNLDGEEKKLLEERIKDYRRLGMHLPEAERMELKRLQKKLSEIETHFSKNIQEYSDYVYASADQLKGLEPSFIESLERDAEGRYRISLEYPEFLPVMEHAEDENLRRELFIKKNNTAAGNNSKLLNEMLKLRQEIAERLGYASWNHYVLEKRMAQTPEKVQAFLDHLESRLRTQADKELEKLRDLKRKMTKDAQAEIHIWDYYFYSSLFKKQNFDVNSQTIKEYFPLNQVIDGMFELFRKLFGIKMEEQKAGSFYRWHEEIRLFKVMDESGEGLGYFYLDLHPREGKYNHAAAFGLIDGKQLSNGRYQRPVSAMVCNFPRATKDRPSLIPHAEVETLFHEFGHILHGLLTRAKYSAFSGTSVAWDFVEAPSQVLENWIWDAEVLQSFAQHYKRSSDTLSKELIEKMNQARKSGSALFYLRQVALAKSDIEMHREGRDKDSIEISNRIISSVFLPLPSQTAFAAGWGHMTNYASGYYGYAWADVMAADLFSEFKKTGILDHTTGRRLRQEIYEPGGSRDENVSLKAFLGREPSDEAFFEELLSAV